MLVADLLLAVMEIDGRCLVEDVLSISMHPGQPWKLIFMMLGLFSH